MIQVSGAQYDSSGVTRAISGADVNLHGVIDDTV